MPNLKTAALLSVMLLGPSMAFGNIAPECDEDGDQAVDGYDTALSSETAQQWNLANATSLAMTLSPLNAPSSYKAFEGAISFELNQIDYLTCQERTVLSGTKSEDTNKTPVLPRPRFSMGLPMGLYFSVTGLPPAKLFGVKTGIFGGEFGGSHQFGDALTVGGRAHIMGGKILGDIAHPFGLEPGDAGYEEEAVDDEYQFVNMGVDLSVSYAIELAGMEVKPYVGAGFLKASSIFYVGEDEYEVFAGDYFYNKYFREDLPSEYVPGYSGLDGFAGVSAKTPFNIDGALEFFFIPVRMAMPESFETPTGDTVDMTNDAGLPSEYVTNYASLRLRVGYVF